MITIRWDEDGELALLSPDLSDARFIIDGADWHDGQGMTPMYACSSLEEWAEFKRENLEGVEDMSFQIRCNVTGRIHDTWQSP